MEEDEEDSSGHNLKGRVGARHGDRADREDQLDIPVSRARRRLWEVERRPGNPSHGEGGDDEELTPHDQDDSTGPAASGRPDSCPPNKRDDEDEEDEPPLGPAVLQRVLSDRWGRQAGTCMAACVQSSQT